MEEKQEAQEVKPDPEQAAIDATPQTYEAPEPAVDEPVQEPVVAEEVAPEVDEWEGVGDAAKFYGLTEDEAKAFGSRETFDRMTLALDKQAATFGREQLKTWESQQKQPDQPAPKKETEQKAEVALQEYKKFELALKAEEYDEDTLKALNGLNDHYDTLYRQQQERLELQEKVLLALGERFVQNTGQSQADDTQKFVTEVDSFFDGLGGEFKDTFGKGAARLLAPNGQEIANRNKLVEEMRVLDIADAQSNRPQQSYTQLAQRALRSLHYDKIQASARREVSDKLKARQAQQVARPSGHNGKGANKREQAIQRVEDAYRSKGFSLAELDDEEIEV